MKKYKDQAIQSIVLRNDTYRPLYGKYYSPDILLVDCNAIFHPACRAIFEPEHRSLLVRSTLSLEEKKIKAFEEVCKTIEKLIRVAQPQKAVYLAIDGVAGCCKQSQQRKRRFKTAQDRIRSGDKSACPDKPDTKWDSSVLTVGTQFMKELCEFIRRHFSQKPILSSYRQQRLRIILNDMNVPGEGEHKLIRFVENDRHYRSYCIYSPDADLIMLGMILPKTNVTILRENIYRDYRAEYFVVNVQSLREAFLQEINRLSILHLSESKQMVDENWNSDSLLQDVVLFLCILGNDFIPHMPSLDIIQDGIEVLLNAYAQCVYQYGYLRHTRGRHAGQFNMESLCYLFGLLKDLEPSLLYRKYKEMKPLLPDSVLEASIEQDQVNMTKYREEYYRRHFGLNPDQLSEHIDQICNEYCKGLMFVILYYSHIIPSFEWFYPYHYSPLCCDLHQFVQKKMAIGGLEYRFIHKPPLTQVEALVSVLHPSNFHLLPSDVAQEMSKRALIDSDFPTEFETDIEGKVNDYEGIILVPMITYEKIKTLLKKFNTVDPPGSIDILN